MSVVSREGSAPSSAAAAARRVDFFIAGMQKGGTTALDFLLRQHPQIQMALDKEPHHFDDDGRDWRSPDHTPLHAQFDWAQPGVVRGEATPIYTFWPGSLERIRAYNPAAKIVVGLRHPSLRAFSHWRMEVTRGDESLPFAEAIRSKARVQCSPEFVRRHFSYFERGLYAHQVAEVLRLFAREQLFFYRTDHLWEEPAKVLTALHEFLGVAPIAPAWAGYRASLQPGEFGAMPEPLRRVLDQTFADDIRRTAAQTCLDLSDWLDHTYREPMQLD
jgi:sulfotransferase family protein